MLTKLEAAARVERGASRLDQVRPGWWNRIDLGTLNLQSCARCVLGQIYDGFWTGVHQEWAPGDPITSVFGNTGAHVLACQHGFALLSEDFEIDVVRSMDIGYRHLQDAWVAVIADRKLRAEQVTTEQIAVLV